MSADNNRLISDYFSDDIIGTSDGKDEKLLLFVFLRYTFKYIHFLYIEYVLSDTPVIQIKEDSQFPKQLLKHNLIRPGYIKAAITYTKKQEQIGRIFKARFNAIRQRYQKFIERASPTIFYKKLFGTYKKKLKTGLTDKYFFKRASPPSHKKVYTMKCGRRHKNK